MNAALSSKIAFHVRLPENYLEQIEATFVEELKVAQEKWGVNLNEDAAALVKKHSFNQLSNKVDLSLKTSWNYGETLTLKIKGLQKGSGSNLLRDLKIPEEVKKVEGVRLILARDGYEVKKDEDDSKSSIAVEELPQILMEKILTWERTAVFYGVGSYRF